MAIFNSYVKLPEGTRERQPFLQGVDDVLSSPGGLFRVARGEFSGYMIHLLMMQRGFMSNDVDLPCG